MNKEQNKTKEEGFWKLVADILGDHSKQLKEISKQTKALRNIVKERANDE
jgi:hypothetical protein